jgi:hypothetical protein
VAREERGALALRHTSGDDDAAEAAGTLQGFEFLDRLIGLGPREVDERARVDDGHVGAFGRVGDRKSRERQAGEHPLGVHEVLRAPQADEGDGGLILSGHQ